MTKPHPVQTLEASLETARLKAIEELASTGVAISPDALRDLAAIQAALTAVREEIRAHGEKLGWGSSATALD
jgi:hypothetical protein